MNGPEFVEVLEALYGEERWPKPFHLLAGARLIDRGASVKEAAEIVGTAARHLRDAHAAADRPRAASGLSVRDIDRTHRSRAIQTLGQLLVGRAAERAFEDIYRAEMESHELELRDLRESRTDTDYRLHNGKGRPVYRINIKFHGALFQRAPELVGLNSEDCFALAT